MRSNLMRFALYPCFNPQLLKSSVCTYAHAGAVGIGDGAGLKQGLFERAIGRDIRYRRAAFTTTPMGESASSTREPL